MELGTSPSLDFVATHLTKGEAEIYWCGPMRIMVNHDRNLDRGIVDVCEVVTRGPFKEAR